MVRVWGLKIGVEVILGKMSNNQYLQEYLKESVRGGFCFVVSRVNNKSQKNKPFYEFFVESDKYFDQIIKDISNKSHHVFKRGYRGVGIESVSGLSLDLSYINEGFDDQCKHLQRGSKFILEDIDNFLLK